MTAWTLRCHVDIFPKYKTQIKILMISLPCGPIFLSDPYIASFHWTIFSAKLSKFTIWIVKMPRNSLQLLILTKKEQPILSIFMDKKCPWLIWSGVLRTLFSLWWLHYNTHYQYIISQPDKVNVFQRTSCLLSDSPRPRGQGKDHVTTLGRTAASVCVHLTTKISQQSEYLQAKFCTFVLRTNPET